VELTTIAGETEELGKNLPQRHFVPPQIPHDQVGFRTPDRSGGKPATNRLSYGAAFRPTFQTLYILNEALPQSLALILNLTHYPTGANKDLSMPGGSRHEAFLTRISCNSKFKRSEVKFILFLFIIIITIILFDILNCCPD
jgi:hypothetical protein